MTGFTIEPGSSILLEVVLGSGCVGSMCLEVPVIISVISVIAHWVLIGTIDTPVSLRIKILLFLGIRGLSVQGVIRGHVLLVLGVAS